MSEHGIHGDIERDLRRGRRIGHLALKAGPGRVWNVVLIGEEKIKDIVQIELKHGDRDSGGFLPEGSQLSVHRWLGLTVRGKSKIFPPRRQSPCWSYHLEGIARRDRKGVRAPLFHGKPSVRAHGHAR